MSEELPTFPMEVMLLRWSETSSGGPTIVLQLADPDDLEPFKAMTLAKGKIAGQRLQAVFVPIDEQEQPVKPKGGELSKLAGKWCKDPEFHEWLMRNFPGSWAKAKQHGMNPEQAATTIVRDACAVASRVDLDHSPVAAHSFDVHFRKPFGAWRAEVTR